MAPLLAFEQVSKSYPDGGREIVVLHEVFLEIEAGMFLGVYGSWRSGKSTLLRLAAGIELADAGKVRFEGRDMAGLSAVDRERLLRGSIALVSADDWHPNSGESVFEHVALALGSSGVSVREARRRAFQVLDRVGVAAASAAGLAVSLSSVERPRVMLARALVHEPRLLLVDEPGPAPSLRQREEFCELLRSVARDQQIALVLTSQDMAALAGADVLATIGLGELTSTDKRGTLVRFPARRAERTSS